MSIKEKLEEIEFHLMTLQQEEAVLKCRKLIREVIEEKADIDDRWDEIVRRAYDE